MIIYMHPLNSYQHLYSKRTILDIFYSQDVKMAYSINVGNEDQDQSWQEVQYRALFKHWMRYTSVNGIPNILFAKG